MLKNKTISTKLKVLGAVICVFFIIVLLFFYNSYSNSMYDAKREMISNVVDTAIGTAGYYYSEYQSGSLSLEEAKSRAIRSIEVTRYDTDQYFFIIDSNAVTIMHATNPALNGQDLSDMEDPNGTKLFSEMVDIAIKDNAGYLDYLWEKPGFKQPVPKISFVKYFREWDWIIGSGVYVDDIKADLQKTTFFMFGAMFLFIVAIFITMNIFTNRTIKKPISNLINVVNSIKDGDLSKKIEVTSQDEIGKLLMSMKEMSHNLNDVLSEINVSSEQVFSGATQVADGSQELSQGATEQASSLEELTATVSQIASQTKENANNANEANRITLEVKDNAVKGNDQMTGMLNSMKEINDSSQNISKIIKVIDDIAFQTNLLALNAAVEAARAGQHGKGFAVVAEEVRNLAARSANAAKETTSLIEGSISKVQSGTDIANETAKALIEIVNGVEKASSLVSQITIASNEQATGVSQINEGLEQVSKVVQSNSATAEQSAAASEELSSQADMLKEMVNKFRLSNDTEMLEEGYEKY